MRLVSRIKPFLKKILYVSGAISVYQRVALRNTLTVLMFHRVLPPSDPRFRTADPAYTMSLTNFEACIRLCQRHFNVISPQAVQKAFNGSDRLPPRALLITFDDGWEDTARYAVPALSRLGLPCAIFIPGDVLTSDVVLWKDVAFSVWRAGQIPDSGVPPLEPPNPAALIKMLATMSMGERRKWLEPLVADAGDLIRPLMMTQAQIHTAQSMGAAIGAHGASHTPLTECLNPRDEFVQSRRVLVEKMAGSGEWFSFPHGSKTKALCAEGFESGFELLFTSDAILNKTRNGQPTSRVIGRIDMPEHALINEDGGLCEQKLSFFLTLRPSATL